MFTKTASWVSSTAVPLACHCRLTSHFTMRETMKAGTPISNFSLRNGQSCLDWQRVAAGVPVPVRGSVGSLIPLPRYYLMVMEWWLDAEWWWMVVVINDGEWWCSCNENDTWWWLTANNDWFDSPPETKRETVSGWNPAAVNNDWLWLIVISNS